MMKRCQIVSSLFGPQAFVHLISPRCSSCDDFESYGFSYPTPVRSADIERDREQRIFEPGPKRLRSSSGYHITGEFVTSRRSFTTTAIPRRTASFAKSRTTSRRTSYSAKFCAQPRRISLVGRSSSTTSTPIPAPTISPNKSHAARRIGDVGWSSANGASVGTRRYDTSFAGWDASRKHLRHRHWTGRSGEEEASDGFVLVILR